MYHREMLPLRMNAARIAGLANEVLSGLPSQQRHSLDEALDKMLDRLSKKCGRQRKSVDYTITFTQKAWMPRKAEAGELRTDIDFLLDRRVFDDPDFQALLAHLSKADPHHGLLQLISALIIRDLSNNDLWSIQRVQPLFDQLIADRTGRQSHAHQSRKGGAEFANVSRRARYAGVIAYVTREGKPLLDAKMSRARCIQRLAKRCARGPGSRYPSARTIERAFDQAFPVSARKSTAT